MDRTPGIRPRPGLWQRLDAASRLGFPAVLAALGLLALSAPLGLPGQAELQPTWVLACVFFWSLFRPNSMPPVVVFLLGLLANLLGLAPPGVPVVILLATQGLALRWRRTLTRQGFMRVWLVFIMIAAGAALLEWALTCLLTWRLYSGWPGLFEFLLATGIYPALSMLLIRAHRGLAAPEQA